MRRAIAVVVMFTCMSITWFGVPRAGAAAGAAEACPRPTATAAATPLASVAPYRDAVAAATAHGLQVWLEADLLKRWWQGAASFRAGVRRLVDLGTAPGVVGFKIADELGYGDAVQQHPACLRAFVRDSVRALHRASPHSQVLIDLVVPDLGCVPGVRAVLASNVRCEAANDARYPGLTLPEVDRLLAMKAVDVVDLSTGLLEESTYRGWHLDAARAQRAAWSEVRRRQWSRHVTLNGRKALAHPGNYTGSAETAAGSASVFVDTPLQEGARAVDVWTWRQEYEGDVYRLADPGLQTNALWNALVARHGQGALLITHFSPSSVEQTIDADLEMMSHAFSAVFIATGTG